MNAPSAVRPSDLMRDGAEALLLAPSLQRRRLQQSADIAQDHGAGLAPMAVAVKSYDLLG